MKRSVFQKVLLSGVLASFLTMGASAQQAKYGVVDMKKAFDAYYKTKQAEAQIKERAADSDKVFKGMIEDYKKANDEYRRLVDGSNDQAVSAEERERRKKSAETKLMELQEIEKSVKQFETQAKTSISEMERRMRDKIVGEIREVVNTQAKSGGYHIVFDLAAVTPYQTPIILYTSGDNDLTETVIRIINASAPAGALSGTETGSRTGSQ